MIRPWHRYLLEGSSRRLPPQLVYWAAAVQAEAYMPCMRWMAFFPLALLS